MKKQIIQSLKSVGKFLSGLAAFYVLFCIIIIIFARSFLSLNPDQYRVLKNGLLFLLFFIVAVPIKFRISPIKEKIRSALHSIPRPAKPQLISLAWLVAKIVLWGITIFFIVWFLVFETFYPLLKDSYPDGYTDLGTDLGLLANLTIALVAIRLIVLHFYPKFSYSALLQGIGKFVTKRKIPPFFAVTSSILLIFSVFIIGNLFLGNQTSTLNWSPKRYNEYGSLGKLTINRFSPDQNIISGTFLLTTNHLTDRDTLSKADSLVFGGEVLPINKKNLYVYSDVDVEISGSDYYFPFNEYKVDYLTFYPENGFFVDEFDFQVTSNLTSIVLVKNYNVSYNISPYSFFIRYSLYFKLLVITIGIAFLGFFVAIVMAKTRNQIVELSIGTFAALIAIRGYLVPGNISSPILLDQIFLLFIILLLVVFLLKVNQLKWEQ